MCKTRNKSDKEWGHPCLFKVKFTNLTLFGVRKNNVHKSGLVCLVIECNMGENMLGRKPIFVLDPSGFGHQYLTHF